jgi:hypothetical protein
VALGDAFILTVRKPVNLDVSEIAALLAARLVESNFTVRLDAISPHHLQVQPLSIGQHYRQEGLTLGLAMSCLQNWTGMEESEQQVVLFEVSG